MSSHDDERHAIRQRIASASRVLVVIAGPNGAGETTFAEMFLQPLDLRVVNVDAIAAALFPDAPPQAAYEAARAALMGLAQVLANQGPVDVLLVALDDRIGTQVELNQY